jgi:uncharacterized protein YdeI (YjbR/CyaY-like superfamily)
MGYPDAAMGTQKPRYFKTPDAFRKWLERHHASKGELLVGYYKVGSGRPSMTWSESVDQALCFGWIDGVRRRIDDERYCIRFTPRRSDSKWSDVNLKKVAKLKREGLMTPAGLATYERRVVGRRAGYPYEENVKQLTPAMIREFRSHGEAWEFFQGQAPSYKMKVTHWITSAKQAATRERRLSKLIEACEKGEV